MDVLPNENPLGLTAKTTDVSAAALLKSASKVIAPAPGDAGAENVLPTVVVGPDPKENKGEGAETIEVVGIGEVFSGAVITLVEFATLAAEVANEKRFEDARANVGCGAVAVALTIVSVKEAGAKKDPPKVKTPPLVLLSSLLRELKLERGLVKPLATEGAAGGGPKLNNGAADEKGVVFSFDGL